MRRFTIFMILFLMFAAIPRQMSARSYALCVGLNDYPYEVANYRPSKLRVSVNDAKVMKQVFAATGFSTSLLTDSAATCKAVLRAMKYRFCTAKSNDVIIFYFSGHGTEKGLLCYDGLLTNSAIAEEMGKCKAKTKMIVADACFSGIMRNDTVWRQAFSNAEDVVLFLSSRANEVSRETWYSNSLFTMYLERGLRGGADANRDQIITLRELYDFVHNGVINDDRFGSTHHPVMWGCFDGNSPVVNWQDKNDKKHNTKSKINVTTNN